MKVQFYRFNIIVDGKVIRTDLQQMPTHFTEQQIINDMKKRLRRNEENATIEIVEKVGQPEEYHILTPEEYEKITRQLMDTFKSNEGGDDND